MSQLQRGTLVAIPLIACMVWLQGCGGPTIQGGMAKTTDDFAGRWVSYSVTEGSSDLDTQYEFVFLKPNLFIATQTDPGAMTSLSGSFVYNMSDYTLSLGTFLSGDLDFPENKMRLITPPPASRVIMLKHEDNPTRFDALNGLWECNHVSRNGEKDSTVKYELRFLGADRFQLIKTMKNRTDSIKGTYSYDSKRCYVKFKDASNSVIIAGTIINIDGKLRIRTHDGVEYLMSKKQ